MDDELRTDRSSLRRKRDRGFHDRASVNAILDAALIGHVGFATSDGPVVLPTVVARLDDVVYLHGAAGNHMLRTLARGVPACVTVTLVDGVVLARSAFHHSINYRSVVLFGVAERVTDPGEQRRAMDAVVDQVAPGRSADARPPTIEELRATLIVRLPIVEGSAKVRNGGPVEEPADLALPIWGGHVPVGMVTGSPVGDDHVAPGTDPPVYPYRFEPSE